MNQRKFKERWEQQVWQKYNEGRKRGNLFFPFRLAFAKAGIVVK